MKKRLLRLAFLSLPFATIGTSAHAGYHHSDEVGVDQDAAITRLAALQSWLAAPADKRDPGALILRKPLSRSNAELALRLLATDRQNVIALQEREAMSNMLLDWHGKKLAWESRVFGSAPAQGRSLWISLHGGGSAPKEVNDQQWRNQVRLYEPSEGIYLAPRAPTDTWNLWHEDHVDELLQQLIDIQVAINHVDPNRVYLLGYSAGGDGVWQLAPRMADRFAAAATMAGHPNDASLLPLRNLPFGIFMGGADAAYDRNKLAAEMSARLVQMHAADPGGYVSMSRIYPGLPHWMNRRDAEALPWMARFTRNPWPKRFVWVQDDVSARRFYWLALRSDAVIKAGDRIDALVRDQAIELSGAVPKGTMLRLSDHLLDLDKPIRVTVNGKVVFDGRVSRTAGAIRKSLEERFDPASAATAMLTLHGS